MLIIYRSISQKLSDFLKIGSYIFLFPDIFNSYPFFIGFSLSYCNKLFDVVVLQRLILHLSMCKLFVWILT